jgi:hypothetical protein
MPPPIQMIQPKRFMRAARIPLPPTTMGREIATPRMTSAMSPWAAAAMASTLSRLMVMSATMMIQIACQKEVPCRPVSREALTGCTSL